jgi:hypothetical protein
MDEGSIPEGSVLSSPAGRNYGQPEPAPKVAFQSDLAMKFERYIQTTPRSTVEG